MGRSPCCEKVGLKKGPWTLDEDQKLLAYIEEHGHGSWRALPAKAGLQRCGKSCRLRWTNYLRPDIKRGKFSLQEEQTIIQLHALLGNRWSAIATHLPKRTDNEIKNYWNTHLKKRLAKMGIDPVSHKPKIDALSSGDGQFKSAANLSHMAQWESARLEAEARLVRESKLRAAAYTVVQPGGLPPEQQQQQLLQMATLAASSSGSSVQQHSPVSTNCLDVLGAWQGQGSSWSMKAAAAAAAASLVQDKGIDLESPSSNPLTLSEAAQPITATGLTTDSSNSTMLSLHQGVVVVVAAEEEEDEEEEAAAAARGISRRKALDKRPICTTLTSECNAEGFMMDPMATTLFTGEAPWISESSCTAAEDLGCLTFTGMLQDAHSHNSTDNCGGTHNAGEEGGSMQVNNEMKGGEGEEENNKDYWNSVLKLLSSSFSNSPSVF